MTVSPHFHTTDEARAAITKIQKNNPETGQPTSLGGGSASNTVTRTPEVTSSSKGDDWVGKRGV